jgi:hypothetical protein
LLDPQPYNAILFILGRYGRIAGEVFAQIRLFHVPSRPTEKWAKVQATSGSSASGAEGGKE